MIEEASSQWQTVAQTQTTVNFSSRTPDYQN
jgi:hypothetical protein